MNPDLIPESIVAVDAGDSFRKVQTVSHQRMGKAGIRESSASVALFASRPTEVNCGARESGANFGE